MMKLTPSEYVAWVALNYPEVYDSITDQLSFNGGFNYTWQNTGMPGVGADEPDSWSTLGGDAARFIQLLTDGVLRTQHQVALDRYNLERARQGLPPVDERYQLIQQPGALQNFTGGGAFDWQTLVSLGGLALLAMFAFGGKRGSGGGYRVVSGKRSTTISEEL